MIEFFIVIAFWTHDGDLGMQHRRGLPSMEACERGLRNDLVEFRRQFPAATGACQSTPPRPEGLPSEQPKAKKGAVNA